MPEQDQGKPGHNLNVPEHVDLTQVPQGSEATPAGVEVVKPNADYEAKLMHDYREMSRQGMAARVGPQPAQADIPAIMQPAKAASVRERETAETIKRGRGRPRKDGAPAQPRGGDARESSPNLESGVASEHGGRENAPGNGGVRQTSPSGPGVGGQSSSQAVQEDRPQASASLASPTHVPEQATDASVAQQQSAGVSSGGGRDVALNEGASPSGRVQPEDKETRAAAVALLRKLESLSSEWAQRIDALRIERRMRDDQIVLMLLARGIESPDYLELPPDHPYFADNFTPAGAPFRCIVCGKVGSMLYPGQRPLCVNGEMECASRFNQLSDEDKQELLSEAMA